VGFVVEDSVAEDLFCFPDDVVDFFPGGDVEYCDQKHGGLLAGPL
jgi:hypothetical protein